MNHRTTPTLTLALTLLVLSAVSCLSEPETEDPGTENPGTEDPGTEDPGAEEMTLSSELSPCGGFAEYENAPAEELGYCDAEQLGWSYDAETRTLELLDSRILLNCCGDRTVEGDLIDGVYVITEIDRPEGGEPGGRCNCMCVFDFAITLEGVPEEVVSVRLVRDSDDEGGPRTVWDGTLDLSLGAGSEVIDDTDVGPWCQEPPAELSFSGETSECGGFAEAEEPVDSGEGYCDAERLTWTYDADGGFLDLTDARVLLNCCGEHDIDIVEEDGVYVITETDAPVDGAGRCDCMCVFDFALTASGIPAGTIPVRLQRHVTDEGAAPAVVWEGELDLAAGAGEVIIDETDVGMWCGEVL